MSTASPASVSFLSAEALLAHWQGHRRLTRRLIEAYPEDQLFTFSVGGMRPFGVMVMELISIAAPAVRGVVTNQWETLPSHETSRPRPRLELLRMWDESTAAIDEWWPQIPEGRFGETMTAFGLYPGVVYDLLLYAIDNEIHHRGQGYVFLRALGIAPPPFFER
jgi:uncharacterized damage-inducible protein DinB